MKTLYSGTSNSQGVPLKLASCNKIHSSIALETPCISLTICGVSIYRVNITKSMNENRHLLCALTLGHSV